MPGADQQTFGARVVEDLLGILYRFSERLLNINVAISPQGHPGKGRVGSGRGDDMNDAEPFGREEFLRCLETSDARHDIAHRRLGRFGRIGHRHQLGPWATQNRARVVLRVPARTDERNP
jgi:hypothetical protein